MSHIVPVSYTWDNGTRGTKTHSKMSNYSLQQYQGRNTRFKCPKCEKDHCFTLYVDENGKPIDMSVGRCDHQESCGYHYTPKQFFADNPGKVTKDEWNNFHIDMSKPQPAIKKLYTIAFDYVRKSFSAKSTFIEFLCSIIDRYSLESPTIERVMRDYCIGATNDRKAVFWQIDINGRVRTGKVIAYNAENGHRIKEVSPDWIHSILKKRNELPTEWELSQCLFGEHLLKKYPDKVVALVEAEKTAIICSAIFPKYVWLSVGSVQNLSSKEGSKGLEMLKVLSGRKVIIYPDADGFEKWLEASRNLSFIKCRVSDIIEKNATKEEKAQKIDIADWIINQLQVSPIKTIADTLSNDEQILQMMLTKNPTLQKLIDAFDLQIEHNRR